MSDRNIPSNQQGFGPNDLPPGWTEACEWATAYCRQMFNKDWHDDSIAAEYMAARNGYLAAYQARPAAETPADAPSLNGLINCQFVKRIEEIAAGWGEPRHNRRLGVTLHSSGINCGHVYDFVDAVAVARGAPKAAAPRIIPASSYVGAVEKAAAARETTDEHEPCVSHLALNEWQRMFDAWVKHQAGLPSDVPLWPNPDWSQDVAMVAFALARPALKTGADA